MITVIQRLTQEHQDLCRLLDVLARQLNFIQEGQIPDYYRMRNILHYLMEYPGYYHDPYEDLMYDRLAERKPQMADVIKSLYEEHDRLAVLGWQALTLVQSVLDGSVPRAQVYALGSAYVSAYRAHMQRVSEEIFTAANVYLTPVDWLQIDAMFACRPDPIFGPEAAAEYQALRDCSAIETGQRRSGSEGEECCNARSIS